MNALGRLSIRARLYFGTIFSLVLLVIIGAMGFIALDRTRGTLEVLFSQRVQTLTDMSDLRTALGDLRRAEKDIIINFNNTVEVAALRESWGKTLAALRKSLADVRQVQAGDAAFVAAIDKSLDEIKQYEAGIVPIFDQIERAQIDGAGGGAYADRLKTHMDGSHRPAVLSPGHFGPGADAGGAPGRGLPRRHHVRPDWRGPGVGPGGADSAHHPERALDHPFIGPGPRSGRAHCRG